MVNKAKIVHEVRVFASQLLQLVESKSFQDETRDIDIMLFILDQLHVSLQNIQKFIKISGISSIEEG